MSLATSRFLILIFVMPLFFNQMANVVSLSSGTCAELFRKEFSRETIEKEGLSEAHRANQEYWDQLARYTKYGKNFLMPEYAETLSDMKAKVIEAIANSTVELRDDPHLADWSTENREHQIELQTRPLKSVLTMIENSEAAKYPRHSTIIAFYLATRVLTVEQLMLQKNPQWIYEKEVLMGELRTGDYNADLMSLLNNSTFVAMVFNKHPSRFMAWANKSHVPLFESALNRVIESGDGFLMTPIDYFIHDLRHIKIILAHRFAKPPEKTQLIKEADFLTQVDQEVRAITDSRLRLAVGFLLFFSLRENIYKIPTTKELYLGDLVYRTALYSVRQLRYPFVIEKLSGGIKGAEQKLRQTEVELERAHHWIMQLKKRNSMPE